MNYIIIIIIVFIIARLFLYKKHNIESFSNQNIATISNIYNNDNEKMNIRNVNVTGNINANKINIKTIDWGKPITFITTSPTSIDNGHIDFYNINTNSQNRKARIRSILNDTSGLIFESSTINLNTYNSSGIINITEQVTINGAKNRSSIYGDGKTHFNHHSTGDNFIRGDTNIDGHLRIPRDSKFCMIIPPPEPDPRFPTYVPSPVCITMETLQKAKIYTKIVGKGGTNLILFETNQFSNLQSNGNSINETFSVFRGWKVTFKRSNNQGDEIVNNSGETSQNSITRTINNAVQYKTEWIGY